MLLKSLKIRNLNFNAKIQMRHFCEFLNFFKPSFLRVDVLEKKMNLSIHTYSKKFKRVCTLLQVYCWNASRISVSHFHCLDIYQFKADDGSLDSGYIEKRVFFFISENSFKRTENPVWLESYPTYHYARNDKKYQSSLCANMAYIFENYTSVETFWCKNWIHTCTILGDSHSQLL